MKTKKINITENVRGYKNISLKLDTYSKLFDLSQKVFGVPISIAKTVEFLADNYVNGAQANNHVPSNYNVVIPQYLPKQVKRIGVKK
jgi:hypothetical protein